MDGRDPNRPDRNLGREYGDTSVRGFDVTCSAPKSVSVLFALGDDEVRQRVLQSHDRAVEALVGGSNDTPTPGTASAVKSPSSTPKESSPRSSASTRAAPSTRRSTPTLSSRTG